jgi:hypothetical protein
MKEIRQDEERSFYYRYCIVCKTKYANVVSYFKQLLKENDFDVKEFIDKERIILLLSQTNEERILREAQHSKINKIYLDKDYSVIPELPEKVIENEKRKIFAYKLKDSYVPDSYYDNLYDKKKNDGRYGLDLFTEGEMLSLENKIMSDIHLNEPTFLEYCRNTPLEHKLENIKKFLLNDFSIFQLFLTFKVISDHFPLHVGDFRERILKDVTSISLKIPYRKIRSYYGDYIAIYYAWIFHYTRFLLIPAIASIIITILSFYFNHAEKYFVTLYAIIVALWSQFFIVYWDRKCGEISIEWDNYTEAYDRDNIRKEFKGEWRISPVTEKYEKYYSTQRRKKTYILSFLVSLPAILVSLFVNVCFLNLSGYILPHMSSFLEIEFLGKFAEKGRIFDVNSKMNTVITIVHGIVLVYLNGIYRKIAEKTNEWENHRIKSNYENSLIIKRFAFEFFNGFISFFYLAFVIGDLQGLKSQLVYHSL